MTGENFPITDQNIVKIYHKLENSGIKSKFSSTVWHPYFSIPKKDVYLFKLLFPNIRSRTEVLNDLTNVGVYSHNLGVNAGGLGNENQICISESIGRTRIKVIYEFFVKFIEPEMDITLFQSIKL